MSKPINPVRTSTKLREVASIAEQRDEDISVGELSKLFGTRAIGGGLIILSLIAIIPGVSIIAGLLIVIVGAQTFGGERLKLPKAFTRKTFSSKQISKKLNTLAGYSETLEKRVKPRLSALCYPPFIKPLAVLIMLLGFCISIPLPLTNFLPAIAILVFSIALVERDGLLFLFAVGISILALITTYWVIASFIELLF